MLQGTMQRRFMASLVSGARAYAKKPMLLRDDVVRSQCRLGESVRFGDGVFAGSIQPHQESTNAKVFGASSLEMCRHCGEFPVSEEHILSLCGVCLSSEVRKLSRERRSALLNVPGKINSDGTWCKYGQLPAFFGSSE
jgi:hypothetical protein